MNIKDRLKILEAITSTPAYILRQVAAAAAKGDLRWRDGSQPNSFLPGGYAFFLGALDKPETAYERFDGAQWETISNDEFKRQYAINTEGLTRWRVRYHSDSEAMADYIKFMAEPERSFKEFPPEKVIFEKFTLGNWAEISETEYNRSTK